MTGKKYDQGKTLPDLILRDMSQAIMAVAEVATFGANKYAAGNWLSVDDAINRYSNAKQRHMLLGATESHDEESGLLHAAHEAWNALAVLELMLRDAQSAPADRDESLPNSIDWDAAEKHMVVVGQNGNDGAAYVSNAPKGADAAVIYSDGTVGYLHSEDDVGTIFMWNAATNTWIRTTYQTLQQAAGAGALVEL